MPTRDNLRRWQRRTHAEKLAAYHARRAKEANGGRWAGSWSGQEWESLLAAWGYTCAYCGTQLDADALTPDHVVPLVRGGRNAITNLVPACSRCNSRKGRRTASEYRAYLAHKKESPMPQSLPHAVLVDRLSAIHQEAHRACATLPDDPHDRARLRQCLLKVSHLLVLLDDLLAQMAVPADDESEVA